MSSVRFEGASTQGKPSCDAGERWRAANRPARWTHTALAAKSPRERVRAGPLVFAASNRPRGGPVNGSMVRERERESKEQGATEHGGIVGTVAHHDAHNASRSFRPAHALRLGPSKGGGEREERECWERTRVGRKKVDCSRLKRENPKKKEPDEGFPACTCYMLFLTWWPLECAVPVPLPCR